MKLLFDIREMKVGCALMQAIYGGTPTLSGSFDTKHWFLAPTENMKLYNVTEQQVEFLIEKMNKVR